MTDYVPEPRDVPVELTEDYDHEVYPPAATRWNTVGDQLDQATKETLIRLAGFASVGEPTP